MPGARYKTGDIKRALYFDPRELPVDYPWKALGKYFAIAFRFILPSYLFIAFFIIALMAVYSRSSLSQSGWILLMMIITTAGTALHEWLHWNTAVKLFGSKSVKAVYVIPNLSQVKLRLEFAGPDRLFQLAVLWSGPVGPIILGIVFVPVLFLKGWPLLLTVGWICYLLPHVLSLIPNKHLNDGAAMAEIISAVNGRSKLSILWESLVLAFYIMLFKTNPRKER